MGVKKSVSLWWSKTTAINTETAMGNIIKLICPEADILTCNDGIRTQVILVHVLKRHMSDVIFLKKFQPFTWWEINKLYSWMTESLNLLEFFSSPESNTFLVKGRQEWPLRRPSNICLSPSLKKSTHWICKYDIFHIVANTCSVLRSTSLHKVPQTCQTSSGKIKNVRRMAPVKINQMSKCPAKLEKTSCTLLCHRCDIKVMTSPPTGHENLVINKKSSIIKRYP